MNLITTIFKAISILTIFTVVGCAGRVDEEPMHYSEISRIAATKIVSQVYLAKKMKEGNIQEALEFIDVMIMSDLTYVNSLEELLETDDNYLRVRNKALKMLEEYWSTYPPEGLAEEGVELLKKLSNKAGINSEQAGTTK